MELRRVTVLPAEFKRESPYMAETGKTEGLIAGIALRQGQHGPMRVVGEASAEQGGGIEPGRQVRPARGITFLSKSQWEDVCAEIGEALPWHTRRANVLVDGLDLRTLPGREIAFGEVRVRIVDETPPCGVMDAQCQGLRKVLEPDMRAGVHGEVVEGGTFQVGDTVRVVV